MYKQAMTLLYPALKANKKYSALVIVGALLMIGFSVAFNHWRGFFYNNVQTYNVQNVWIGIAIFVGLALLNVVVYGLYSYYTRFLEFGCREHFYDKFKDSKAIVPNKDQRLQEDTLRFSRTGIALLKALLDSSVRLPVFLFILWSVAKWWMVLVVLVYAVVGTILSKRVANKLIVLEYEQERREANLRRQIITSVEDRKPMPLLTEIKENWLNLALRNKYLAYYTSFYGQVAVIFPFIMLLPFYLNHVILLGVLFQAASAIEQVLESLSVFVNNRDVVVDLSMVTKRLGELE